MEIIIALICVAAIIVWLFRNGIDKRSERSRHIYRQPPASAPTVRESLTYHTPPPRIPDEIAQPFDYQADWWKHYSLWFREETGWCCQHCRLSLRAHKYLLHTHHIWGTRQNQPYALTALCIGCYAEQPGDQHTQLKNTDDYQEFMALYGKKWRLLRGAILGLNQTRLDVHQG